MSAAEGASVQARVGDDLVRVSRLSPAQEEDLHRLFRGEWWTSERGLEDVRRLVAGSDVVVGFAERGGGRLVAFARALTDGVCKALVFDVVVAAERRGTGLGRRLMDALLVELAGVAHVELTCRPELEVYRRYAFQRPEAVVYLRATADARGSRASTGGSMSQR